MVWDISCTELCFSRVAYVQLIKSKTNNVFLKVVKDIEFFKQVVKKIHLKEENILYVSTNS